MPTLTQKQAIQRAVELIRAANEGVALTGAGISTPSGIPDFRSGSSGLWARHNPMEVASLSAFRYSPDKFFTWIRPLAAQIQSAKPNPAHLALAQLEKAGHLKTIITQNIDGLHQRAGSTNVLEVHGSVGTLTCVDCFRTTESRRYLDSFIQMGTVPRCGECGSILKPDVVLFGEQLPIETWHQSEAAARSCDLMIVAGSSLEAMPVAGLPMHVIERAAHLIIVNYSETYVSDRADAMILGNVAEVLPRITEEVCRA